jgi:hypothetical protein
MNSIAYEYAFSITGEILIAEGVFQRNKPIAEIGTEITTQDQIVRRIQKAIREIFAAASSSSAGPAERLWVITEATEKPKLVIDVPACFPTARSHGEPGRLIG